jgi:hypothetical protein
VNSLPGKDKLLIFTAGLAEPDGPRLKLNYPGGGRHISAASSKPPGTVARSPT